MSDVFATLATGTLRSSGNAPAGGAGETAVRVIDPSPDFSRLTIGENLRGTVVGKDDHGHLLVRTRLGVLQLTAHRNLPIGSEVVLQVRSVGPQVVLNLLPLDSAAAGSGAAAGPAAQAGHLPAPPPGPGHPALPPNPHDLVQRGQVIRGVLHAAAPLPLLAGLPTAQPGAELLVRILSLGVQSQAGAAQAGSPAPGGAAANPVAPGSPLPAGPGAATTAPGAGGPLPQGGSIATPAAGSASPSTPAQAGAAGNSGTVGAGAAAPGAAPNGGAAGTSTGSPATSPPATGTGGGGVGLRLAPQTPVGNSGHSLATALQSVSSEAAARAAGSLPPAAAATPGGTTPAATAGGAVPAEGALRVTGLVTAATSSGQPILHTPLGTITLDTRASLPPGSSLALHITLPAAPNSPAAQALAAAWPSLEALEETVLHSLPPAQMEAVARALPQIGPRLASGVLFFLSALNQGNPLGWLAPAAAAAAERGDLGDLYERLGRDFAGLNRSIETPAGEWRFVNLPLWSQEGLRELRCFFRHQQHGSGKGKEGDKATRFVLELELERHGELQLDGLVRARRFDLMLRSRRPLSAVARGDLMALFEEANAIAGYSGQLVFQVSTDWHQMLSEQSAAEHHEGFRV